jgi:hypothetical protein
MERKIRSIFRIVKPLSFVLSPPRREVYEIMNPKQVNNKMIRLIESPRRGGEGQRERLHCIGAERRSMFRIVEPLSFVLSPPRREVYEILDSKQVKQQDDTISRKPSPCRGGIKGEVVWKRKQIYTVNAISQLTHLQAG